MRILRLAAACAGGDGTACRNVCTLQNHYPRNRSVATKEVVFSLGASPPWVRDLLIR